MSKGKNVENMNTKSDRYKRWCGHKSVGGDRDDLSLRATSIFVASTVHSNDDKLRHIGCRQVAKLN